VFNHNAGGSLTFAIERHLLMGREYRMGSARVRFNAGQCKQLGRVAASWVYVKDGTHRGAELASEWAYFSDLLSFTTLIRQAAMTLSLSDLMLLEAGLDEC